MGLRREIRNPKDKRKYTTNENTLNKFRDKCKLADYVLEFRHHNKMVGTYLAPVLEKMDSNSRFHTSFMQHGTKTGRLAASILHQVEKLDDQKIVSGEMQMRHMYCVEPGYVYVHGDFSQIELKAMAIEARDPALLKAVFEGDVHNETAAAFLKMTLEGVPKASPL